ncbi:MAG: hypothetical protein AAF891_12320, partial [Pseudomonadota bacterium]
RDPADARMSWMSRNAQTIEAFAAILTACVALAALIAIPMQIRAAAKLQAEQSARDIYRGFIALSVEKPQLASPDYCALQQSEATQTSYAYYVEYMLYTAEQVIDMNADWVPIMVGYFDDHRELICAKQDLSGYEDVLGKLITSFQQDSCENIPTC